jgi:GntR family transcriptional regulator
MKANNAAAMLAIDTADPRPIWRQIEESLEQRVAAGALAPGEPVASVRDLARALRVNPATVAKAFQRLVDRGVLETRRGDGTYVAQAPPELRAAERRKLLVEAATRLATVASSIGAGADDAHAALDEALRRLGGPRKDGR